jgi:hypothetical protein
MQYLHFTELLLFQTLTSSFHKISCQDSSNLQIYNGFSRGRGGGLNYPIQGESRTTGIAS